MYLLLSFTCCTPPTGHAQTLVAQESSLQAALLFNFAVYTEWPALGADSIEFCVMGSQPVWEALSHLQYKKIKGQALAESDHVPGTGRLMPCAVRWRGGGAAAECGCCGRGKINMALFHV